ncbi:prolyl 3-hydroxylase 3 isoform X2 [Malaclemys terrapin pileata]|uniref:prolyl 3-hydroxylase 3 isoform X2 n=1 Tax=Malaclemys terrapin pileata TaxID=2991368 RepID=UPI0023A8DE09|nr:prolyl 3-hydroxylase 3 isoform X2 [Malaclemys terrapin pileata]
MASLLLLLLALSGPGTSVFSPGSGRLLPYDLLYADGVRAYFARDWPRAAELLQRALHSYSQLLVARRGCQGRCREEAGFADPLAAPSWETRFFDRILQRAECLGECLGRRLGSEPSLHRASREIQEDFEQREPYNYLQVALFQLKKLDEAVSAAHTFFVANPQHLQMREDMEKYQRMAGVKLESFRDLQATLYWEAYETGVQQYNVEEYLQAAVKLEESLKEVLLALEDCRALCEGPQEDGTEEEMQPGLYEAIAAHYIQVLKCRQHCVLEVATKPGRISATDDFIPSHLDLLQFAYDQVGNQALAAECAASYLLFYPSDELMLEKMKRYQAELGEEASMTAREDPWTPDELIPGSLKQKHRENREKQRLENLDVGEQEQRGPFSFEGITVAMDSHQLNGSQRVVFDRVLTDSECKDILRLAKAAGGTGDGYRGRQSPHTPHERFEGLTVLKALQLAQDGIVNWRDATLLLHASEKSRKIVESYFTPGKRLHFSFTHLVCRTAVEGDQDGRMDLSHPVHADNCLLDPEGKECWREPPAYMYRDFSGILYLNDDFHGGDLFFTEVDAVTVTAQVRPKCGKLVAFSSGRENPHGIWAVTHGRRCAIALWYTLSPEHAEQERMEAEDLMRQGDMEQELSHTDVEEHMGTDHSGGASPEPPVPKGRARSTSQRRTSGSESGQQPQKLRARDEF